MLFLQISKRTVDDAGFPTEAQVCCLDHCPNGYSRFAETLFQVKGVQLLPPSDEHAKYAIPCPGRDAAHNYVRGRLHCHQYCMLFL